MKRTATDPSDRVIALLVEAYRIYMGELEIAVGQHGTSIIKPAMERWFPNIGSVCQRFVDDMFAKGAD